MREEETEEAHTRLAATQRELSLLKEQREDSQTRFLALKEKVAKSAALVEDLRQELQHQQQQTNELLEGKHGKIQDRLKKADDDTERLERQVRRCRLSIIRVSRGCPSHCQLTFRRCVFVPVKGGGCGGPAAVFLAGCQHHAGQHARFSRADASHPHRPGSKGRTAVAGVTAGQGTRRTESTGSNGHRYVPSHNRRPLSACASFGRVSLTRRTPA